MLRIDNQDTEVLIVDDDPAVRSVLGKLFARAGFEVTAAANGLAALDALGTRAFGAVVCDIRMEPLDGMQLYGEIAAEYPDLRERVFFISAAADDPEIEARVGPTGRPLLRKPLDIDDLLHCVCEAVVGPPEAGAAYRPFSVDDAGAIRGTALGPGSSLTCPRCGNDLRVRSTTPRGQPPGWEIRCDICRRSLTVPEVARQTGGERRRWRTTPGRKPS